MSNQNIGDILTAKQQINMSKSGPSQMMKPSLPSKQLVPDPVSPLKQAPVPDATVAAAGYNIFGFQISKTMCYILIGIVLLIVLYFVYKWWNKKNTVKQPAMGQVGGNRNQRKKNEEDEDADNVEEEVDEEDEDNESQQGGEEEAEEEEEKEEPAN